MEKQLESIKTVVIAAANRLHDLRKTVYLKHDFRIVGTHDMSVPLEVFINLNKKGNLDRAEYAFHKKGWIALHSAYQDFEDWFLSPANERDYVEAWQKMTKVSHTPLATLMEEIRVEIGILRDAEKLLKAKEKEIEEQIDRLKDQLGIIEECFQDIDDMVGLS